MRAAQWLLARRSEVNDQGRPRTVSWQPSDKKCAKELAPAGTDNLMGQLFSKPYARCNASPEEIDEASAPPCLPLRRQTSSIGQAGLPP